MSWSGLETRVGDVVGLGVLLADSLEVEEALWLGLEFSSAEDSPQPTNSPPMINAAAPATAARARPAEQVFVEFSSTRFTITPIDSVGRLMRLPRSKPLSERESSAWANLWITPAGRADNGRGSGVGVDGGVLVAESIGVIGGGIVGIAIARALAMTGDVQVSVIEKEDRVAAHQTGHNSGVVHAGLYYHPGSLKAQLCARGRQLTREFCQQWAMPYRELGKLVVAVSDEELPRLDDIERRSRLNRVPGLARMTKAEMTEIEPHVNGVAALHSPETAVVDYVTLTETMAQQVRRSGGEIHLKQEVVGVTQSTDRVTISTTAGSHRFDRLVVCAGLQSDLVARLVGASPSPRILPFRGEYWTLAPSRSDLVRGMIYPVPDPRFPFLGVHFTRGVYDDVHVGPNAVPALAREGYSWGAFSARDTFGSLTWPSARALARQHWRMGAREMSASLIKPLYYRQARVFLPELRLRDLAEKSGAGVRAQAWDKDGSLLDDFAVDQVGPVTLLRNAPSPAATSAMAIAEYVLERHLGVVAGS